MSTLHTALIQTAAHIARVAAPYNSSGSSNKATTSTVSPLPWGWTASHLVSLLAKYPAGATEAMVHSEIQLQWLNAGKLSERGSGLREGYTCVDNLLEEGLLGGTLATEACLELQVVGMRLLGGDANTTTILTVSDEWSEHQMEMYLHPRYSWLLGETHRLLESRDARLRMARVRTVDVPRPANSKAAVTSRLLPTDTMAVVLDSKLHAAFLQHYFGAGGKATSIESVWAAYQYPVAEGDDASAVALCLLVKIAAVAAAECTGGRSTLAVRVQDSSAKEADLVLLDDQIELAQLMAEGDSLALINPFMRATKGLPSSSCPAEILVGSQTLVFIVPAPPAVAQETVPLSQYPEPNRMGKMVAAAAADTVDMVIPVNSKGALDCRFVGVPIRTADLRPGMVNVTLIAVVESVEPPSLAQDDLLNDPQQPVSFYSIRVNDSNGSGVAVRVPNDHAVKSKVHSPRRFLPGHVVLLEHVSVSRAMTITCHGSVVNISILQGTSQSRGLLALGGPLQMDVQTGQSILVDATLLEIIPRQQLRQTTSQSAKRFASERALRRVHDLCLQPVTDLPAGGGGDGGALWSCAHCTDTTLTSLQTTWNFDADLRIATTGAASATPDLVVACLSSALAQILEITPGQFGQTEGSTEQAAVLASMNLRRFRFLLCRQSPPHLPWRVDGASPLDS